MSTTGSLSTSQLRDVHETARLGPYLGELWDRRRYIWYSSMQELRHRQITSVLGNLWHLLNPALTIAVYYVVFGVLLDVSGRGDNFLLFLAIGLFVFQYTQKSTTLGAMSIIANKGLIKAFRFPRTLLPLSSTLAETIASFPTFAVMYVLALAVGETVTYRWLLFPFLVGLLFLFNLGAAMVAARLSTHFADTVQVLPFVFRLLMYGSGVMFDPTAYITDNGLAQLAFVLNPVYCMIEMGRWCIIAGELKIEWILSSLAWTVALLIGGFAWFRAGEETFSRD